MIFPASTNTRAFSAIRSAVAMTDDEIRALLDSYADDEIEITFKDGTTLRGTRGAVTDGYVTLGAGRRKSADVHSIKRYRKIEGEQGPGGGGPGNGEGGSGPER